MIPQIPVDDLSPSEIESEGKGRLLRGVFMFCAKSSLSGNVFSFHLS